MTRSHLGELNRRARSAARNRMARSAAVWLRDEHPEVFTEVAAEVPADTNRWRRRDLVANAALRVVHERWPDIWAEFHRREYAGIPNLPLGRPPGS